MGRNSKQSASSSSSVVSLDFSNLDMSDGIRSAFSSQPRSRTVGSFQTIRSIGDGSLNEIESILNERESMHLELPFWVARHDVEKEETSPLYSPQHKGFYPLIVTTATSATASSPIPPRSSSLSPQPGNLPPPPPPKDYFRPSSSSITSRCDSPTLPSSVAPDSPMNVFVPTRSSSRMPHHHQQIPHQHHNRHPLLASETLPPVFEKKSRISSTRGMLSSNSSNLIAKALSIVIPARNTSSGCTTPVQESTGYQSPVDEEDDYSAVYDIVAAVAAS